MNRRRWRIAALLAALSALSGLVWTSPASATLPGGSSTGRECAIRFTQATANTNLSTQISCNVTSPITSNSLAVQNNVSIGTWSTELYSASPSGQLVEVAVNSGGHYRATFAEWNTPCCGASGRTLTTPTCSGDCTVTAWDVSTAGYPAYPGPVLPAPPTPTCTLTRTLSTANGANLMTAQLAVTNATAGTTDAVAWAYGDTTTAGNLLTVQHAYPALSSQPSGGWTATATITRTGDGTIYAASPTVTATCSVRVDFYNPTQASPGGTGFDTGDDAGGCPSGWSLLNPAAIGSILRCLFIPDSAHISAFTATTSTATTKAPFSWAADAVSFLPDVIDRMHTRYAYAATHSTPYIFGPATFSGGGASTIHLPGHNVTVFAQDGSLGASGPLGSIPLLWALRAALACVFYLCIGFATYQLVTWCLKS